VLSVLFDFLGVVANSARESDREYSNKTRLIQIVGVALEPDRQRNAEIVLHHVEPINRRHGFMAKVDLDAVPEDQRRLVQNVLNAAMTMSAVQRHDRGGARRGGLLARAMRRSSPLETTYLVHTDLFKTLLLYRAGSSVLAIAGNGERQLTDARPKARTNVAAADHRQDRLLANGRRGNGATNGSDQGLERRLRQELLSALGVTPAALDNIWEPEIAGEALAAANVLKRQARNRSALRNELMQVESDLRRALERGQDAIAAKHGNDRRALTLLQELTAEIDKRVPALLLLPGAGLIERLISALEDAYSEDGLGDDEHLLLSRLRKLNGDLQRMNPKDASAWRIIARELEHLTEPAVAAIHPTEGGTHH
jgi:hypothetical protein